MVALIVFSSINYHHTIIYNKMFKYNTQKQVYKHKEDSCSYYIVRDIDGDVHVLF